MKQLHMSHSRFRILGFPICIFLLTLLLPGSPAARAGETSWSPGEITPRVTCLADSEQSYALYLPSGFTKDKTWPILFAFDPGARAQLPLKRFRPAADRFGYIVVCSYNSRNGPHEPVIEAMQAVWRDTLSRLPIDRTRVYTTGFSGGARVASFFSKIIINPVRGVIACGAGLSAPLKPEQLHPSYYYGLVGVADFNYPEMKKLSGTLDRVGVPHRIVFFDGIHTWPTPERLQAAVGWLEIQAMRSGHREVDEKLIDTIYNEELGFAREEEDAGSLVMAVARYRAVNETFAPWRDTTVLSRKIQALSETKAFKRFQKNEEKREEKRTEVIKRFVGIFGYVKTNKPGIHELNQILTGLNLGELRTMTKRGRTMYDRGLGTRLLADLASKARREAESALKAREGSQAVIFYEITVQASLESPYHYLDLYNLACAYAIKPDKKRAFRYLKQAVEAGFTHADYIMKDEDLSSIRETEEFKKIINMIKEKQGTE